MLCHSGHIPEHCSCWLTCFASFTHLDPCHHTLPLCDTLSAWFWLMCPLLLGTSFPFYPKLSIFFIPLPLQSCSVPLSLSPLCLVLSHYPSPPCVLFCPTIPLPLVSCSVPLSLSPLCLVLSHYPSPTLLFLPSSTPSSASVSLSRALPSPFPSIASWLPYRGQGTVHCGVAFFCAPMDHVPSMLSRKHAHSACIRCRFIPFNDNQ